MIATPEINGTGKMVWLASYPKSGNTWFRILRSNLISGRDDSVDINGVLGSKFNVVTREVFDSWTLIESGMLTAGEIDALRPPVAEAMAASATPPWPWVKVHDRWRLTADGEPVLGRASAHAAIYLVRDARDVAVSFAHHLGISMDEAVDCLNTPELTLGRTNRNQFPQLREELGDWSSHVTSWLDQSCVPVHVVRYEDLKQDTAGRFACALRFSGESFSTEEIERAVRLSALPELRKQEQANGFRERMSGTSPFFRRGEVGAWRDELTVEQAERIVRQHGKVMRRLGYFAE